MLSMPVCIQGTTRQQWVNIVESQYDHGWSAPMSKSTLLRRANDIFAQRVVLHDDIWCSLGLAANTSRKASRKRRLRRGGWRRSRGGGRAPQAAEKKKGARQLKISLMRALYNCVTKIITRYCAWDNKTNVKILFWLLSASCKIKWCDLSIMG